MKFNFIQNIVNTLQLLIYKENPAILEYIDLADEKAFLEPLLFTYFNRRSAQDKDSLFELLQADVITDDLRLIERILFQFRDLFQR